jgi:hypothetical protein
MPGIMKGRVNAAGLQTSPSIPEHNPNAVANDLLFDG